MIESCFTKKDFKAIQSIYTAQSSCEFNMLEAYLYKDRWNLKREGQGCYE